MCSHPESFFHSKLGGVSKHIARNGVFFFLEESFMQRTFQQEVLIQLILLELNLSWFLP